MLKENCMPAISVVMPLYNAEKYVKKTIHSILNQTYRDFELIIVDDCSTDNSVQVVESIQDNRIKLFCNEKNMGIAYTRNRALENSNGKYIAIMDDDDISPEYRFEVAIQFMENNPHIDVVGGNTCIIDENDTVVGIFPQAIRNPKLVKAQLMLGNIFGNSTALVRREFIEKHHIRYKDNMYGAEDYQFWAECSLYGDISACDNIMLYWRRYDNETKKKRGSVERKKVISGIQKNLIDYYGFSFTDSEYELLLRIFEEDGKVQDSSDIQKLYQVLQSMVEQSIELQLDNAKEIAIMCRKWFGKKCSTAFYMWEEKWFV